MLGEGRFFIKRQRGEQEGYLVLAPFTFQSLNVSAFDKDSSVHARNTVNRKLVLNMGWIPKSRKHLAYSTVPNSVLGEEVYESREEALEKEEIDGIIRDPLEYNSARPVVNITAFIRRSEEEDANHGRTNFKKQKLYKWINLRELSRVFRITFNEEEAETVYLERTSKR